MATGNLNYDPEEVVSFCGDAAQTDIHKLIEDLNKLSTQLDNCQDTFHCKGGDNANAVMKIYKNFATIIGSSFGAEQGKGLGGCAALSAKIVNTCYSEAMNDLKIQDSSNYSL